MNVSMNFVFHQLTFVFLLHKLSVCFITLVQIVLRYSIIKTDVIRSIAFIVHIAIIINDFFII